MFWRFFTNSPTKIIELDFYNSGPNFGMVAFEIINPSEISKGCGQTLLPFQQSHSTKFYNLQWNTTTTLQEISGKSSIKNEENNN